MQWYQRYLRHKLTSNKLSAMSFICQVEGTYKNSSLIAYCFFDMEDYRNCRSTNWCYCWSCQSDRLSLYAQKQPDVLLVDLRNAKECEIKAVESTFIQVLNQICISKALRQQIYNVYKYKNTTCYFKSVKKDKIEEANRKGKAINRDCLVYDRFHEIVANLKSCPYIDIKRLTTNQLNQALCKNWCYTYNEVMRHQNGTQEQQEHATAVYQEDDYADFLSIVKHHILTSF